MYMSSASAGDFFQTRRENRMSEKWKNIAIIAGGLLVAFVFFGFLVCVLWLLPLYAVWLVLARMGPP